jgi:pimeloyl-ACP methyl ester carboxylesterase
MQTKTIAYQNSVVNYRVTGTGQTVVLLHGFGESGTVWQPQIDFLKPHFKLIIPDIPGSGQSSFIPNATLDTYAEVIKEIIDVEVKNTSLQQAETVALIGHSMGGYITLAFAEKYPHYLNSFGLFHSTAFADSEEKKEARRKSIEFIKDNGVYAFLKTSIPGLFTKAYAAKYPDKITNLMEEGKNFKDAALIQYHTAMMERPDRTHVLRNFQHPILFIIGEHDTAIPLQTSLQQCYLPYKSFVNILDQSGHMGMWEETEKANNLLLNFLVNKF